MRWIMVLAILFFPFSVDAQEATVEIAGLTITRGMPEEAVRRQIVHPNTMWCDESDDGDFAACVISSEEEPNNAGEIVFENGRVSMAARYVDVPEEGYDAIFVLYELLAKLTNGEGTCAIVRTGDGMPLQFSVELPQKFVSVTLHWPGNRHRRNVALSEGLRRDPTPHLKITDCRPGAVNSSGFVAI